MQIAKTVLVKAIKEKCLDCCAFQLVEREKCTAVNCPLHPYRLGITKKELEKANSVEKSSLHK